MIPLIIQDQFYTIQNLQRSPIPQTSYWSGTFFAVSYNNQLYLDNYLPKYIMRQNIWNPVEIHFTLPCNFISQPSWQTVEHFKLIFHLTQLSWLISRDFFKNWTSFCFDFDSLLPFTQIYAFTSHFLFKNLPKLSKKMPKFIIENFLYVKNCPNL